MLSTDGIYNMKFSLGEFGDLGAILCNWSALHCNGWNLQKGQM